MVDISRKASASLRFSQQQHWQFSTLRWAQYSTMMILHHLHHNIRLNEITYCYGRNVSSFIFPRLSQLPELCPPTHYYHHHHHHHQGCAHGGYDHGTMVVCDMCSTWYHTDCVGLTEAEVHRSRISLWELKNSLIRLLPTLLSTRRPLSRISGVLDARRTTTRS